MTRAQSKALEMVKNKLEAAMVANGFADYDEEGRFVPNHHEARRAAKLATSSYI